MAGGMSMAVSICDMTRSVLEKSIEEGPTDAAALCMSWVQTDAAPAWIASNLTQTKEFTSFINQEHTIPEMLEKIAGMLIPGVEDTTDPGAPPEAACQEVVGMLLTWWEDTEHPRTKTIDAMKKSKQQLPMLAAVKQALSMFPSDVSAKLDAQAASVGDSVRKQIASAPAGKVSPGDVVGAVMQNPQFMAMMQDMMQGTPEDSGQQEDEKDRDRNIGIRLSLIEHRLQMLEGSATGTGTKARKKKGSRR
jgi:hypothetical protein